MFTMTYSPNSLKAVKGLDVTDLEVIKGKI